MQQAILQSNKYSVLKMDFHFEISYIYVKC